MSYYKLANSIHKNTFIFLEKKKKYKKNHRWGKNIPLFTFFYHPGAFHS